MNKRFSVIGVVLAALLLAVPVLGQDTFAPAIDGVDQLSIDGTVTLARVVASAPSFVAIHADNSGTFGEVIGFAPVNTGENPLVLVPIDAARATPTLFAVLHSDDGQIGTFEFDTVAGADAPVMDANGQPVVDSFAVDALVVGDQIVDSEVSVANVTVAQPSWLVIYAGDNQNFTTPIGQTFLDPGTYANVPVAIDSAARTTTLWPAIHVDTGVAGEFEFGTVDGADLPLVLNDRTAALPISTAPSIRLANNQFTLEDNGVVSGDTATVTIQSVLSEGPGFVVIHNEANGGMGDVIGVAPVSAGTNRGVTVEIDSSRITPNLWVELHTDTNNVGEFEFGTVADADPVAAANGQNVSFAARVGPFLNFNDLTVEADHLIVSQAVMDGPGFVVVQADDGTGNPGVVLGEAPVNAGPNQNISIPFAPDSLTGTLYLALHQDTNQIGVFENETVEGADNLLLINNQPVLGQTTLANVVNTTPATPMPDTSAENPAATTGCAATIAGNVNLRSEPSTAAEIVDVLAAGTSVSFVGVTQDAEGFNWWQTADGGWIRSDVVEALGDACGTFVPATAP
jgi:hypothetical protein